MSNAAPSASEHEPGSDELRAAENRRIRRYVNMTTCAAARRRGGHDLTVRRFVCECGRVDCDELVALPLGSFDAACKAGPVTAHD